MPGARVFQMVCAALVTVAPLGNVQADDIATLFNVVCAQCHEGECSRRLTFDSGRDGAAGHIRRHAGALSDEAVGALYDSLVEMKDACAFQAADAEVPESGRWDARMLAGLGLESGRGWFVPLGRLEPGEYRLAVSARAGVEFRLHVVGGDFELIAEDCLCAEKGAADYGFEVEGSGTYFLRITSRQPLGLSGLSLSRR